MNDTIRTAGCTAGCTVRLTAGCAGVDAVAWTSVLAPPAGTAGSYRPSPYGRAWRGLAQLGTS